MILKYKKGDVLTRIRAIDGKFVIQKYKTLNDSTTALFGESSVSVPLIMIYTNDQYTPYMETRERLVFISTTFTDDGVEKRKINMGDLFIIGDKEETINKAKAHMLLSYNIYFREKYRTKK